MHLISYDIQDDALRLQLAKLLIQFGLHRIQYSVFMGRLKTSRLPKLQKALQHLQTEKRWHSEDSIMLLPLHQYSEDNLEFIGPLPDRWLEITEKIHTLIL